MNKKTIITYTLLPGKKLAFVRTVIEMWSIPYRTRWELIWTALTGKDNEASAALYWPPAECARFIEILQRFKTTRHTRPNCLTPNQEGADQ